jgi:hypothetical protein
MEDRERQKEREEESWIRREMNLQEIYRSEGERTNARHVKRRKPVPKALEGLLRAVGEASGAEQGAEEVEKAERGAGGETAEG